jgi:SAM-dependent methyltransferase
MSARDAETASSAGSSAADVDLDALVARLRDEIRWAGNGVSTLSVRARARSAAEQFWAVTAERPPHGGAIARLLKRVLRKAMRWYVEPLAQQQRSFNDAALRLIDALGEELDRLAGERGEHERLLHELEERLLRVERGRAAAAPTAAPATVAAQPRADALPDYFAFESRMRGPTEVVRQRQRRYVDVFRSAAPVLDLGCGRGELLMLLREAGVAARGVDADADMVAFARGEGLDVEQADVVEALEGVADGTLGGVFAGQLVEHLPPARIARVLELAYAKLRADGLLVLETINPLSPLALRNYFADLTHAQPLVPETLSVLVRGVGFRELETRYLSEPMRPDGVDPHVADILFAPLDYAIVARR